MAARQDHVEWLSEGRRAWNERRKLVDFEPQLAGVDFTKVRAVARSGPPKQQNFASFDLSGADLRAAKLTGLNFSRANFRDANLLGADLSRANFVSARFDRADLSEVYAVQAVFRAATLRQVRLFGAVLEGADFRQAKVEGAQLPPERLLEIQEVPAEGSVTADRYLEISPSFGGQLPSSEPSAQDDRQKEPRYLVLFATNRNPLRLDGGPAFGSEMGHDLSYGSGEVVIPHNHKVGSPGSPFWRRLIRGDDRLKVRRLITLNNDLYWQLVRENFSASPGGTPPTLLIHGYNNTFEQAVLWAAQIGYDLGLEKGVSLFSWPSKGKKRSYPADEDAANVSKYHLRDYLSAYIENANGARINIIAHSMGCRCLISALELIGLSHPDKLQGIGQIIMAAADVDQGVLRHAAPHVVGNYGRTTSYACSGDIALALSGWLHSFDRVGLLPPIFMVDDIDTVEVEKTDLIGFGHGYVSGAKSILNDMFQLIRASAPPEQRFSVRPASIGSSAHWKLVE